MNDPMNLEGFLFMIGLLAVLGILYFKYKD